MSERYETMAYGSRKGERAAHLAHTNDGVHAHGRWLDEQLDETRQQRLLEERVFEHGGDLGDLANDHVLHVGGRCIEQLAHHG